MQKITSNRFVWFSEQEKPWLDSFKMLEKEKGSGIVNDVG